LAADAPYGHRGTGPNLRTGKPAAAPSYLLRGPTIDRPSQDRRPRLTVRSAATALVAIMEGARRAAARAFAGARELHANPHRRSRCCPHTMWHVGNIVQSVMHQDVADRHFQQIKH
jgi:hypothetical protein